MAWQTPTTRTEHSSKVSAWATRIEILRRMCIKLAHQTRSSFFTKEWPGISRFGKTPAIETKKCDRDKCKQRQRQRSACERTKDQPRSQGLSSSHKREWSKKDLFLRPLPLVGRRKTLGTRLTKDLAEVINWGNSTLQEAISSGWRK